VVQTTWAVVNRCRGDSVARRRRRADDARSLPATGAHGTANPRTWRGGVFSERPMTVAAAAVADTLRARVAEQAVRNVTSGGGGCYTCACGGKRAREPLSTATPSRGCLLPP